MIHLVLAPLELAEAIAFVDRHHHHNDPVVGHLCSSGAKLGGSLVAVSIVGRPIAGASQDGFTVEIRRVASNGPREACSFLSRSACRAAFGRSCRWVVTYTLASECGASLRAAGSHLVGSVSGRHWDTPSRRRNHGPLFDRLRWEQTS
ncbi:XF1762 family protein [Ancylobacter sp.]|uniref:XF1762 family protein n=1 Tax=Ancylobacter sp. TaxID=1872567 RepID=UPI003D0BDBE4